MKTQKSLEEEKTTLSKLHYLRDYIFGNFDQDDALYHQLLHVLETAINDKIEDISLLRGAKIKKNHLRKKYVFEVDRHSLGAASIYLNGECLTNFLDEIVKVQEGDVIFTDVVRGLGSRIPDALFVKALLYSDICHLSDKVKAVLDRDIPYEILQEQRKSIERFKASHRSSEGGASCRN